MKQAEKGTNQRKLRIILIIAVVILWALIFYKIYKTFFGKSSTSIIMSDSTVLITEKSTLVDTFSLKLNYIDPFLKHEVVSAPDRKSKENLTPTKPKPNQKKQKDCVWEEIKFGGLIKNKEDNRHTALLKIKGKSFIVKENELIKDYLITRIYKDSITLKKENCLKTFYKAK